MPILAASTSENGSTVVLLIISPYQQTAEPFGATYCDWYPLLQNHSGEKQQGMLWIMVLSDSGPEWAEILPHVLEGRQATSDSMKRQAGQSKVGLSKNDAKRTKQCCRRCQVYERALLWSAPWGKSICSIWLCCASSGVAHSLILMSLLPTY